MSTWPGFATSLATPACMQAGQVALRLEFPERVTDATALRKMLVRLAGEARAKTE